MTKRNVISMFGSMVLLGFWVGCAVDGHDPAAADEETSETSQAATNVVWARLAQDTGGGGRLLDISGPAPCGGPCVNVPLSFNDMASSVEIINSGPANDPCRIELFADTNCTGASIILGRNGGGFQDLTNFNFNDVVSSVR
jgi:hypothetical protein